MFFWRKCEVGQRRLLSSARGQVLSHSLRCVVISGVLTPGTPRLVLARLEPRKDVCFTSERLLVELERVLIYPRIERGLRKAGLHWRDVLNWVIDHTQLVIARYSSRAAGKGLRARSRMPSEWAIVTP